MIPVEDTDTHWLIYGGAAGWGCTGCDWTGTLDNFYKTHAGSDHDSINIPF